MSPRDPRQTEREEAAFEAFLRAYAALNEDTANWEPAKDEFPDIETVDKRGARIGWELGEWLVEDQTAEGKRGEDLRQAVKTALAEQGENFTEHIRCCMLSPRTPPVPFIEVDQEHFLYEVLALVREVNARWPANRAWHSPQGFRCTEFAGYPTTQKYIDAAIFEPSMIAGKRRRWPPSQPWIVVELGGGSYDPQIAVDALVTCLKKKIGAYGGLGKADVRLIVYYDTALLYNTPFHGIEFDTFGDVARYAAERVKGEKNILFSHIYVLHAPLAEAFEIHPELRACK